MAGKTFVAVDRASLDSALADADHLDKILVAEGAFDAIPRLAVDGARWRLNGWAALPTAPAATATAASTVDGSDYASCWAALARVFADTMGPARRASPVPTPPAYVIPARPIISYVAAYARWVAVRHESLDGVERPSLPRDGR